MFQILLWSLLLLSAARSQTIFKCSPVDGALDTYSFTMGSDSGVACVRGGGAASDIVLYLEKMTPDGTRKMAVGAARYDADEQRHEGHMYRLFPAGPKQPFTLRAVPGFLQLHFEDGPEVTLNLRPDGLPWVPADMRAITGCAMDTPQLLLDVQDEHTRLSSRAMLCALGAQPGEGYEALYGFGLRPASPVGWEPFFFLGQSTSPLLPAGPLNIIASVMDVCMRPDCRHCRASVRSLTLS